ncbi:MAG: outer membrane beta-barrel protein [Alphaproteobacteria bacterium]|nr:outer membrane beta-barrel protein [Alphaproteobacteria bacterium]
MSRIIKLVACASIAFATFIGGALAETGSNERLADDDLKRIRVAADARRSRSAQAGGGWSQAQSGRRSRSIYEGFGNAVFARAGVAFAADESNADRDAFGVSGTLGYRRGIARKGRSVFWIEPAAVYFSDSQTTNVGAASFETTFSGTGALLSLGYAYDLGRISPFATAGAGALKIETEVDDGFSEVSTGEMSVGYAGVAGVQARLFDDLALEAAYRYLGSVRTDIIGIHSLEVGVSYRF